MAKRRGNRRVIRRARRETTVDRRIEQGNILLRVIDQSVKVVKDQGPLCARSPGSVPYVPPVVFEEEDDDVQEVSELTAHAAPVVESEQVTSSIEIEVVTPSLESELEVVPEIDLQAEPQLEAIIDAVEVVDALELCSEVSEPAVSALTDLEMFADHVVHREEGWRKSLALQDPDLRTLVGATSMSNLVIACALGDGGEMEEQLDVWFDGMSSHLRQLDDRLKIPVSAPVAPPSSVMASGELERLVLEQIVSMDHDATLLPSMYRGLSERAQDARTNYNLLRHEAQKQIDTLAREAQDLRLDLDLTRIGAESEAADVASYRAAVERGRRIVQGFADGELKRRECERLHEGLVALDAEQHALGEQATELLTRLESVSSFFTLLRKRMPEDLSERVSQVRGRLLMALDRTRLQGLVSDASVVRIPPSLVQFSEDMQVHEKVLTKLDVPAAPRRVEGMLFPVSFRDGASRTEVLRRLMIIAYDIIVSARAGVRGRGTRMVSGVLSQGLLISSAEEEVARSAIKSMLPLPGQTNQFFAHTYMYPERKRTDLYRPTDRLRMEARSWLDATPDGEMIESAIRHAKELYESESRARREARKLADEG